MTNGLNAITIAAAFASIMENEDLEDVGVALGIVRGTFVLQVSRKDSVIDEGIDAIAEDAKNVARKIREAVQ